MVRGCLALAVALLLGVGQAARASTLSYHGFSVIDAQTVTLSGSAVGGSERVTAGAVVLQNVDGTTSTVESFCIDVKDMLRSAGSFAAGTFLGGALGATIDALLVNGLSRIGSNPFASAALQVAIWEAEYGSSLTVSGNGAVTDLAALYLGNVSGGTWRADPTTAVATLLAAGTNQDQAMLAKVPEPASMMLLGGALLGAAGLRWRGLRRAR